MKKIEILVLLMLLWSFSNVNVFASGDDYVTYQEVTFEEPFAELLVDYSDTQYENAYNEITGKRFWGWKIEIVNKNEPCSYIASTLYSIYNEGTTPISQSIEVEQQTVKKLQMSSSGTIEVGASGSVSKFKLGLDETIKSEISTSITSTVTLNQTLDIDVDPGTMLTVRKVGEANVSNGVGKYYRFWKMRKKGGWETFVITTEYYEFKKEVIPGYTIEIGD